MSTNTLIGEEASFKMAYNVSGLAEGGDF